MKKTRETLTVEGKNFIVHTWKYDSEYRTQVYIPVQLNLSQEDELELVEKRNAVEQHILSGTIHLLF